VKSPLGGGGSVTVAMKAVQVGDVDGHARPSLVAESNFLK
jgi:hypothetical protein